MKLAYPIIMSKGKDFVVVYVPDFKINTQGVDYADAMEMARDAIGIMGIDMEDDKEQIPVPSAVANVRKENESDIVTLVDVDFTDYRRKNDTRAVRRNVSLPCWLDAEADRAGINVSAVLQAALKNELNINSSPTR